MLLVTEKLLFGLVTVGLLLGAAKDWRTRQIPFAIGGGMLVAGLVSILLRGQWLAGCFFLAAVWGSRGGVWRFPFLLLAIVLFVEDGLDAVPLIVGILYVLSIFWLGWFGGGDAQIAFGLIALAADWFILGYIFGTTILLALILNIRRRGFRGTVKRVEQIIGSLNSPDKEAIRVPWAVIAAAGGLMHIWIWPGGIWR